MPPKELHEITHVSGVRFNVDTKFLEYHVHWARAGPNEASSEWTSGVVNCSLKVFEFLATGPEIHAWSSLKGFRAVKRVVDVSSSTGGMGFRVSGTTSLLAEGELFRYMTTDGRAVAANIPSGGGRLVISRQSLEKMGYDFSSWKDGDPLGMVRKKRKKSEGQRSGLRSQAPEGAAGGVGRADEVDQPDFIDLTEVVGEVAVNLILASADPVDPPPAGVPSSAAEMQLVEDPNQAGAGAAPRS